jgi:hypothetical protein
MTIATAHFLIRVVSRGLQVARSNEALGHAGGPICVVVGKLNPYTSGVVGIVGLRVNEKVAGGDVFPLGQIKGSRVDPCPALILRAKRELARGGYFLSNRWRRLRHRERHNIRPCESPVGASTHKNDNECLNGHRLLHPARKPYGERRHGKRDQNDWHQNGNAVLPRGSAAARLNANRSRKSMRAALFAAGKRALLKANQNPTELPMIKTNAPIVSRTTTVRPSSSNG